MPSETETRRTTGTQAPSDTSNLPAPTRDLGLDRIQHAQTSFASGSLSRLAQGRIEHPIYKQGVDESLNCIVHPQGPISNRTGFEFIDSLLRSGVEGPDFDFAMMPFQPASRSGHVLTFGRDETWNYTYMRAFEIVDGRARLLRRLLSGTFNGFTNGNPTILTYTTVGANDAPWLADGVDVRIVPKSTVTIDRTDDLQNLIYNRWYPAIRTVTSSLVVSNLTAAKPGVFTSVGHGLGTGTTSLVRFIPTSGSFHADLLELHCGLWKIVTIDGDTFHAFPLWRWENHTLPYDTSKSGHTTGTPNVTAQIIGSGGFRLDVDTSAVSGSLHTLSQLDIEVSFELPMVQPVEYIRESQHRQNVLRRYVVNQNMAPFEIWFDDDADTKIAGPQSFFPFNWYPAFFDPNALEDDLFPVVVPRVEGLTNAGAGTPGLGFTYAWRVVPGRDIDGETVWGYGRDLIVSQTTIISTDPVVVTTDADPNIDWHRVYRYDPSTAVFRKVLEINSAGSALSYNDNSAIPVWTTGLSDADSGLRAEELFDGPGKWPGAIGFADQRMVLGKTLLDPELTLISKAGDYTDFRGTTPGVIGNIVADDDAISLLAFAEVVQPVVGYASLQDLVVFTDGAELRVGSPDGPGLSPSTISAPAQSFNGARDGLPPLKAVDSALYVVAKGDALREIRYKADGLAGASYGGRELSIIADHYFRGRAITRWAFAGTPDHTAWICLDNGDLISFSYNFEQEVTAFGQHRSAVSEFLDVVALSEVASNGIYFGVRRYVNGAWRLNLERLHDRDHNGDVERAFYVDSGMDRSSPLITITALSIAGNVYQASMTFADVNVGDVVDIRGMDNEPRANGRFVITVRTGAGPYTIRFGDPETGVSADTSDWVDPPYTDQATFELRRCKTDLYELHHLEGEDVSVLTNGNVERHTVVDGHVALDLSHGGTLIFVGLPYQSRVKTLPALPPVRPVRPSTPFVGYPKVVAAVALRLMESRGIKVGVRDEWLMEYPERTDENYYVPTRLFSGDRLYTIGSAWDLLAQIVIQQDEPLPFTVSGIFPVIAEDEH